MMTAEMVIEQTEKWISQVVIGCNFCPFAARVVKQQAVFYKVEDATATNICLETFLQELTRLDDDESIEYPQYTRPENFHGMKVPDVLLSGHHAAIAKWRQQDKS